MAKKKYNSYSFYSQIDLPYLETNESLVKEIFGSYQDMLKLKAEISGEKTKTISLNPEDVTEKNIDPELEYLKLNS